MREELGYPHMSTPFSQFVGVQAVMNVIQGTRYASPPEALRLLCARRVRRADRTARSEHPGRPRRGRRDRSTRWRVSTSRPCRGIRAEHGPFESDEDLLLFLFLHPAAYKDFRKNRRPIVCEPRPHPVVALTGELAKRKRRSRPWSWSGDRSSCRSQDSLQDSLQDSPPDRPPDRPPSHGRARRDPPRRRTARLGPPGIVRSCRPRPCGSTPMVEPPPTCGGSRRRGSQDDKRRHDRRIQRCRSGRDF